MIRANYTWTDNAEPRLSTFVFAHVDIHQCSFRLSLNRLLLDALVVAHLVVSVFRQSMRFSVRGVMTHLNI